MKYVPDGVRKSYLRKFAALTLATLVVVAGAGVVMQGQVAAELRYETHSELETTTAVEANELGTWVEEQEQTTRLLSEAVGPRIDGEGLDAYLSGQLDQFPATTHAIHVVDTGTGTIVGSTAEGERGERYGHVEFAFDSDGDVVTADPYAEDGHELLAFASAVPGRERAVVVTAEVDALADHLRSPIEGGETSIVDAESGAVVLSSNASRASTAFAGPAAAVERGSGGESGFLDTESTVLGYAPVEGTDWVVVSAAPKSNAYVVAQSVTRDFAILIGLALAGFVLIGATMGRSTGRTLEALADRAATLARGEVDGDAGSTRTDRIDEVGRVQNAFADVSSYVSNAAAQADAVAREEFDAPAFERDVPGTLGTSLSQMRAELDDLLTRMEETTAALERAAASHGETMNRAADGDLTARMDADVDAESMARIAAEFNGMMEEFETTVGRADAVAGGVAHASEEAGTGVRETERAAGDVAEAIEEISAGAAEQSANLSEVTGEMSNLSAAVEEVASTADEVAARSTEAARQGERGATLADEAVEEMSAIETRTEETAGVVRSLESEVAEIGEIADLIDEIAEQTNTLALNASIEAARAGGEGDGFAVVADEVKQLATETREATSRIETRIEAVQSSTGEAVDDIEEMRARVDDGADTVEAGLDALGDVVEAVREANDGVQSISTATDDQAASAEEVVAMADEVATVSEETAAEAQTVSAAAEEQSASLDQVSGEVERLAGRADDLRRLTARFETDVATDVAGIDDTGAAAADPVGPAATDGGRSGPTTGDD